MVFADKMHDVIRVLENEGVIVYPTDTIWSIGCSIFCKSALERIHKLKGRSHKDPFVLLCSNLEMLKKYVNRIHPRVETLLTYHERPLTIVYPEARNLPQHAIAANGSVAIRITTEPFSRTIIELLGCPIVSTSASFSDGIFPSSFEDIGTEILQEADYVCYHNRHLKSNKEPSIIASYDKKGELYFIRT